MRANLGDYRCANFCSLFDIFVFILNGGGGGGGFDSIL